MWVSRRDLPHLGICWVEAVDKHVVGGEVAVDDAFGRQRSQPRADLLLHHEAMRQRDLPRRACAQQLQQRAMAVWCELGEEQLLLGGGADAEVLDEAWVPPQPHEHRCLGAEGAVLVKAEDCDGAALVGAFGDGFAGAFADEAPDCDVGGRDVEEVLRAPLLDHVSEGAIWQEGLVDQGETGDRARQVGLQPCLDVGLIVRVAIGADDWVSHNLVPDGAEARRRTPLRLHNDNERDLQINSGSGIGKCRKAAIESLVWVEDGVIEDACAYVDWQTIPHYPDTVSVHTL